MQSLVRICAVAALDGLVLDAVTRERICEFTPCNACGAKGKQLTVEYVHTRAYDWNIMYIPVLTCDQCARTCIHCGKSSRDMHLTTRIGQRIHGKCYVNIVHGRPFVYLSECDIFNVSHDGIRCHMYVTWQAHDGWSLVLTCANNADKTRTTFVGIWTVKPLTAHAKLTHVGNSDTYSMDMLKMWRLATTFYISPEEIIELLRS